MIDFSNTQIAFASKGNGALRKAALMFSVMKSPKMVSILGGLSTFCLRIHFPIGWIIKPTLYRIFVGGESIAACTPAAQALAKYHVRSLLDYSVESARSEEEIARTLAETILSIRNAAKHDFIPFSVFKPSALIIPAVLEKVSAGQPLHTEEQQQMAAFEQRVDTLCKEAVASGKPLLVDAEDYCFQKAIDDVVVKMMKRYNAQTAVIYNTLQMYRTDRLAYLQEVISTAEKENFMAGVKLVRGAYMEKERERALQGGYPSPIHPTKADTDMAFDAAVKLTVEHIGHAYLFCGTHNEASNQRLVTLMEQYQIAKNDVRVFFSQLYGMSDNISFNLAAAGYNVVKYMPYGKVKNVLPYLLRRAQENTSIAGQTGRELSLLKKEIQRRKTKH